MSKAQDLTRDQIVKIVCREGIKYKDYLIGWVQDLWTTKDIPVEFMERMKAEYGFRGFFPSEVMKINSYFSVEPVQASAPHFSRLIPNGEEFRLMDGDMWDDEEVTSTMMAYYSPDVNFIAPSDPFWNPKDESRPKSDINFIRDLVTFTKYTEEGMAPSAPSATMKDASLRIDHEGLASFCVTHGNHLVEKGKKGVSTPMYTDMLWRCFDGLTNAQRSVIKGVFYAAIHKLKEENGAVKIPSRTGLTVQETDERELEEKPYLRGMTCRVNGVTESISQTPTISDYLRILAAERAVRGEDHSKSSFYSSSTGRGGYLEKSRRQICDILSVVLPVTRDLAKKAGPFASGSKGEEVTKNYKVVIVPHTHSLIPRLIEALISQELSSEQVSVYASAKYEEYSSLYPSWIVRSYKKTSFLVDFEGSSIPVVKKGTDLVGKWESQTRTAIQGYERCAGYISWRKIPPTLASKFNVFYFHSIHSFDAIVSSYKELSYAYGRVSKSDGSDPIVKVEYGMLERIKTEIEMRKKALSDSRTRTWAVVNGGPFENDLSLNLWGRATTVTTKKDLSRLAIQFLAKDDEYETIVYPSVDEALAAIGVPRAERKEIDEKTDLVPRDLPKASPKRETGRAPKAKPPLLRKEVIRKEKEEPEPEEDSEEESFGGLNFNDDED